MLKEGQSKWKQADKSFKQAENLEYSGSWFSKIQPFKTMNPFNLKHMYLEDFEKILT